MRWWGWGDGPEPSPLPASAEAFLARELDLPPADAGARTALDDARLPDASLDAGTAARLREVVGDEHVRADRLARVSRAAGKSYPDLVRQRSGDASGAPDAVVFPTSHHEVRRLLEECAASDVAVVPFGGGTSVVGGVEALRGGHAAVIALDLARMDRVVATDARSLTATLEPGLTGPRAEAGLAGRGLTLGHFPQSFEFATIGGFVATRSAGQASTGYGRIDELVLGLRCAAPAGDLTVKPVPASAAGPALRELVVGSEGVLGVITEATLAVRPRPATRRYEGWSFEGFRAGAEALRVIEQHDASPDVARLSDDHETRMSMALAASTATGGRARAVRAAGSAYLSVRGHSDGCLAILGWEGEAVDVARRRSRTVRLLREHGAIALGQSPGRAWARGRYLGPYLRDTLLDRGVMVETLETAAGWSDLMTLYGAVGEALRRTLAERGTPPLVMCHVSHLYPSGASLYFTFLARRERGAELEQWRAAKAAASDAIVAAGGTITHHHAVGRDHVPWMRDEVGEMGLEVLRAAKERLDPSGIMNPGKLLPPS